MKRAISILVFTCACIYSQAQVNIITTICGKDSMGYCCDSGPATNALLHFPDAMCLDKFGNLYFVDALNHRIRKIVLSTGVITTVAGTGIYGYSGDGEQATIAQLYLPNGIFSDTVGNIYIADGFNHRIRKITVATGIITTIAGTGAPGNSGDGGQATNAEINGPGGLYIDKSGNLYIPDNLNNNIRKIAPNGIITTIAGNGSIGYSGDGGPATDALLYFPQKAIVDNYGNIIISDAFNNALRKIDATTGIITTIAGNGTAGYSGNGVPAIDALLNEPHGINIDSQNNIYFAEWGNGTIRKIDASTNIINTIAGTGVQGFFGDGGPATDAKLIPEDLCFDGYGTMYIADFGNQRIRMVYDPKLGVPSATILKEEAVIYPNPANDELTIEKAAGNKMSIFNLLGQQISETTISSNKQSVNINDLPSATYIIQLTNDNGEKQNFRVLKNKCTI